MSQSGAAARPDTVGILGGMGPLATADFMARVIALTPAQGDGDHIPLLISSVPQIPDRVAPILTGAGTSPLPALLRERDFLIAGGAKCLVMPCNTAHYWYDSLAKDAGVPFLHIVTCAAGMLAARGLSAGDGVGLIATKATMAAGMFQDRLAGQGYRCIEPEVDIMESRVLPGIKLVKQNRAAEAGALFREAVDGLIAAGAHRVLLACTEVPIALPADDPWVAARCIDATEALARATVDWALAQRTAEGSAPTAA